MTNLFVKYDKQDDEEEADMHFKKYVASSGDRYLDTTEEGIEIPSPLHPTDGFNYIFVSQFPPGYEDVKTVYLSSQPSPEVQADLVVDTTEKTPSQIKDEIEKLIVTQENIVEGNPPGPSGVVALTTPNKDGQSLALDPEGHLFVSDSPDLMLNPDPTMRKDILRGWISRLQTAVMEIDDKKPDIPPIVESAGNGGSDPSGWKPKVVNRPVARNNPSTQGVN